MIALALTLLPAAAEESIDVGPAMKAAEAWLETVDAGGYGQSWEDASPIFRAAIKRVQWEVSLQSVRERLGPVGRRKLRAATYTRQLAGLPPGEYVVIQYETLFESRFSVETVTPMREKDGSWKVASYLIR